MGESNQKRDKAEKEPRFSQEQYDRLMQCSNEEKKKKEKDEERGLWCNKWQYQLLKVCATDKEGIEHWNKWRKDGQWDHKRGYKDEDIYLEGADLRYCYLKGAVLSTDTVPGVHGKVYLGGAIFLIADLEGADLRFAHLECVNFNGANLESANFSSARLEGAYLMDASLEDAKFQSSSLKGAMLRRSNLKGANLNSSNLKGAEFLQTVVNGSTLIWACKVDRMTDFRGVGLGSARIDAGTKQLLEYNIRRKNWEDWYKGHWFWRWPVRFFWALSDYGRSTGWIVGWFLIFAVLFAGIYYVWGLADPPGIVENLFVGRNGLEVPKWLVPLRTLYFSIVTQTTLGFGDMYANAQSVWGHILLSVQVILGYVLLGALVTRFAVLFTAGGPAGKFAEVGGGR